MMSLSAKPAVVITALAIILLGATMLLRQKTADTYETDTEVNAEIIDPGMVDVRTEKRTVTQTESTARPTSHSLREVTTGVKTLALQTPAALPPLSGYALDQFSTWKVIPAGYRADNIRLHDGTITLAGDITSTEPRTGILLSPPLPLRAPSMAAPASNPVPLPEGASVLLEISLTDDGETWSPWAMVQRFTPPDGKRVSAPLQAQLSPEDIAAEEVLTSAPASGPAIRYRLTLAASGSRAPQVADVRIWKQEYR